MSRVLVAITMLLLSVNASATAPQTKAASSPAGFIVHGPIFRYTLIKDRNPVMCKHMLRVFNDKFNHPWDAPLLTSYTNDPNYSATSKYAFPLLPGVKHSTKATFEMRFSAWPTTPEFSAIHWKEGRVAPGGCPAGQVCPGEGPQPILVAYFDFDNDGTVDTVIKSTFDPSPLGDTLEVWRGQVLKISGTPNLWGLEHPQNKELTPIMMSGPYLRPFIFHGITYVASYDSTSISPSGDEPGSPAYLVREDMLIERYRFAGWKDRIGRPEWSSDTVCDLRMNKVKG